MEGTKAADDMSVVFEGENVATDANGNPSVTLRFNATTGHIETEPEPKFTIKFQREGGDMPSFVETITADFSSMTLFGGSKSSFTADKRSTAYQ